MDIEVTFPGGMKVNAEAGKWVIETDQSVKSGGDGSAPEPYTLFLASLATCAGIYVLRYLQVRNLPTDGLKLVQKHTFDEKKHRLQKVQLQITLPEGIEQKHARAIERTASSCAVKRTIENPPAFEVRAG